MKKVYKIIIVLAVIVAGIGLFGLFNIQYEKGKSQQQAKKDTTGKLATNDSRLPRFSSRKNIKNNPEKVAMYVFWGNGCGYCEQLIQYLEGMEPEYRDMVDIYLFEVWNNKDNLELMNQKAEQLNYSAKAVPFFIIGDKPFSGFNPSMEPQIESTIKQQYAQLEGAANKEQ